jgi:MFS family permease
MAARPDDPSHALAGPHRRRAFAAVFAGVAMSTTGFLASNTVNGLIAEDLTGRPTWSGLPAAASVLGTAAGATALAGLVARAGPRTGLAVGYGLTVVATVLASLAIASGQFVLFVASMFAFGVGYGANRLARYVAADLYPAEVRATMIGWIVWASTIGAVAGPALLAPSRTAAEGLGLNGLIGPYLVCVLACAIATAGMLAAPRGMDRTAAARTRRSGGAPLRTLLAHPGVTLALVSMVSGQFVMVLLMTMTPLHIRHEGHGLGAIGLVISAHTLGMFALSPITGRIGDQVGRVPLLLAGVVTLVLSGIVGAVAGGSYIGLLVALLLLGLGWNLGFVGGSALLTDSLPADERVRVQGAGDAFIWGGGALASIASGWLLDAVGFAPLSAIGAVLALAPLPWLRRHGAAVRGAAVVAGPD